LMARAPVLLWDVLVWDSLLDLALLPGCLLSVGVRSLSSEGVQSPYCDLLLDLGELLM